MVNIRFEPLSYMLLNGLPDLAYQAWLETKFSAEHPDVPYSPDWEIYQTKENSGNLRLVALREEEKLIGYASIDLDTDMHRQKVLIGIFRDIFIVNTKRGHAAKFVNFIEKNLAEIGIRRLYGADRLYAGKPTQASEFYEVMGYEPQEIWFGKTLQMTLH